MHMHFQGDHLAGMVEPIPDRKRAEEEVRAAETRFRASVDHLTDALLSTMIAGLIEPMRQP